MAVSAGVATTFAEALWNQIEAATPALLAAPGAGASRAAITVEMIAAAEALVGRRSTNAQRALMVEVVQNFLDAEVGIRLVNLPNSVQPAIRFSALTPGTSATGSTRPRSARLHSQLEVRRPRSSADLAFLSVIELAHLVRTRRVTSVELTRLYLDRLKRHDPAVRCVVTLTEQRALRQAAQADEEIGAGKYRGPLHGIPYGVKDILAVPDYPTTWGAAIYRNRILPTTATVVERLDAAGAVLVAKLSMGELGLSDLWYGGTTRNPWALSQGATGSSSGSAAAVAAGLVAFSIAGETMGSMVRPATRNGVTTLRPTFGRVSRHGALTISWSLDKIGPMARSVEDCAIVLEAIAGPDRRDASVADVPYAWNPDRPLSSVRVGYFKAAFDAPRSGKARDDAVLRTLSRLGVTPVPVQLPTDLPVNSLLLVRVEAAAAFDEIARLDGIDLLEDQSVDGWPAYIRAARLVPAVDYIQANRIRTLLMQRFDEIFRNVDVFLAPTFGVMPVTNLTGHPCVVAPNGFDAEGVPTSISFIGRPFGESELCTVARAWQSQTEFHEQHPLPFSEQ
jgi:Asp-tRNA(Asn)/Glu-tRNA(Gln) amidotransferase A subunit family amidase